MKTTINYGYDRFDIEPGESGFEVTTEFIKGLGYYVAVSLDLEYRHFSRYFQSAEYADQAAAACRQALGKARQEA